MDKAVKSTAVVTSLFPEAVHERLFADANKSEEISKELDVWKAASNEFNSSKTTGENSMNHIMGLRSSLRAESKTIRNISAVYKKKGRPIADKFPHVTVLFAVRNIFLFYFPASYEIAQRVSDHKTVTFFVAYFLLQDLAGFTKWSSTREPDEVFILLEALYGAVSVF